MTSHQRVVAAFNQQPTDKVPIHHLGFSSEVASALLGREAFVGGGIQIWREADAWWHSEDAHEEFMQRSQQDALDIARVCQHDIVRPTYWRPYRLRMIYERPPTSRPDEYTFLYEYGPEEEWKVLRYDPSSEQAEVFDYVGERSDNIDDIERQVTEFERSVEDFQPSEGQFSGEFAAKRQLGDEYAIRVSGGQCGLPFGTAWLQALALRPDLIERYLDAQVEQQRRIIKFLAEHGFRFFFGGKDFAGNEGPFYSPRVFREIILPRLQQIAQIAHDYGGYLLFASDGNLWPVADDLFGASGIDGYYEIDRRAGMDLDELRRRFPNLTLIGNISTHTVARGTREQVVAETVSCLEMAKQHYGIIVGASNYFVPGTPIENVEAVLETIDQYR